MSEHNNLNIDVGESKAKLEVKNILYLLMGALIAGLAINLIYIPINITMGGVSGLAQSIHIILGPSSIISLGMLALIFNIPILLLGWKFFGFHMVYRSIIGTLVFSTMIDITAKLLEPWIPKLIESMGPTPDRFIFALFGGFLFGFGLGLIFRGHYTTGGTDILAFLAAKYLPHITVGQFIFVFDILVIFVYVSTQAMVNNDLNIMSALYAFVALFITSRITDTILIGGSDNSQACYIISNKSEAIAEAVLNQMERGVTAFHGKGMYTQEDKEILFIVCSNKEIPDLKKLVLHHDAKAFLIVSDVTEVAGEGFMKEEFF